MPRRRRFSDIENAPLLNQLYENYQNYKDRPIADRFQGVGQGPQRSPAVFVAVKPFGIALAGTNTYRVRTNQRNRAQLATGVGTRASTTLTDSTRNASFEPALVRMKVVTGRDDATSKFTGRPYVKLIGESYQHPFGQTGTERELESYEAIVAAVTGTGRRFSYRPERFYQG